ncbi:unnamed protein product [Porites lobata]|uniref:Tyr recombinase domain-containing protein n=1 Tax=Porites lobata TaxID=104759 RepID=A0ABN8R9E6_9CNID|nr:unnamed protein product [Porites lobata]
MAISSQKKLERQQLQTLEIQEQCQPGQDNPDKPIEHLLPATSTVKYLIRTSNLRGSCSQLLICHCKPHGPASKDTISRWLKQVMLDAGINTSVFKPHSTRSAATSAAKSADVPLDEIMTTAGWRSSSVFAVYYNKPLLNDSSFANSVLGKN